MVKQLVSLLLQILEISALRVKLWNVHVAFVRFHRHALRLLYNLLEQSVRDGLGLHELCYFLCRIVCFMHWSSNCRLLC